MSTPNDEYYLSSREYFRQTVIKDLIADNYNIYRGNIDNYLNELIYHIYDALDNIRVKPPDVGCERDRDTELCRRDYHEHLKEDIEWFFKEILKDGNNFHDDICSRRLDILRTFDSVKVTSTEKSS